MPSELLSAIEVRNAKPGDKPRKLRDGNGLHLLVHPNGSKYFQLRYTLHGKEKTLQLGIYPEMGLADARVVAKAARQLVAEGTDPVQNRRIREARKAASATNTFRAVAEQWLNIKKRTLAPTTYKKTEETFKANVYPRFGDLPIQDVSALMVRDAMQVMERRGALEIMQKCRAWIRSVFDFALSEEMIEHNPVPQKDLVLKKHKEKRHPGLKSREDAAQFLRNLFEYPGRAETRLAIWLQMLVATRPGELRLAQWEEFDFEKALWTIPLERMRNRHHMTEPHIVPLSHQAAAALKELHHYASYSKLLFPSATSSTKPISDMTISKALKTIWPHYRIVPHGFRHFFSTMANEHGQFRHDVIEAALAHKDGNAIRATYNRATYIRERRELAQWWADELDELKADWK
ncbi:tyrosine-type recombinase/integrase [Nitrosospira multiformis]|uniref:Integrase n=1 Tax=Nitrosospira multiformis TaxID=1231 RepID=A0A1I7IWC7_9PROT|nr:integrase arm-type DNA-binding domain-containing protein [Nitrosospira multiformis]SFU77240.1 Integrase [Nitrosospira multiformis]